MTYDQAPPPTLRRSPRWPFFVGIAGLTVAAAGVAVFLTTNSSDTPSIAVKGTMSVPWDFAKEGQRCIAGGGYGDISGAQVVVSDSAGKTIATTQLQEAGILHLAGGANCVYDFAVAVPGGEKFYGIEVSHRGRLQYTPEQLKTDLALKLG